MASGTSVRPFRESRGGRLRTLAAFTPSSAFTPVGVLKGAEGVTEQCSRDSNRRRQDVEAGGRDWSLVGIEREGQENSRGEGKEDMAADYS